MTKDIESVSLIEQQQALFDKINELKIEASTASAYARTAPKDERVEAAATAARIRAELDKARNEKAGVDKAIKAAEKAATEAEKERKKQEAADKAEAEKQAKEDAKAEAKAAKRAWVEQKLEAAKTDPFEAFGVDWPSLGKWAANIFQDEVCHVEGNGWGEWTGTHWQFDQKPSAELLDRVRAEYAEKVGIVAEKLKANAKAAEYILDHAQGSLMLPRELFNHPRVAHLVAFRNYTVNLKTGEATLHNPKNYMTGAVHCDYNPNADHQRIITAFGRFWPGDNATQAMFQKVIGAAMTGEVFKRMIFLVGDQENAANNGDNGKSLFGDTFVKFMGLGRGGLGTTIKGAMIVDTGDRDANSHDGAKTPLIWRRVAIASEFRRNATIDAGEFNRFCGGDAQQVRPPHGTEAIEFTNVATGFFLMNRVPRFKTFDKATRIRLTPFEFKEVFYDPGHAPEGGQEKELGLKEWLLSKEGQEAFGLYAVRGAIRYYAENDGQAGNIKTSPAVADCRDRILNASNPHSQLFEESFIFDKNADTLRSALYSLLDNSMGRKAKPYEKDAFMEALLDGRGCEVKKIKGLYFIRGVGLTADAVALAATYGHLTPTDWRESPPKTSYLREV